MGTQFDKLYCELLKEYYREGFKEFSDMKIVKLDLIYQKKRFVKELYDKIEVLPEKYVKIDETGIAEGEAHRIFDERNTLDEKANKILSEIKENDNNALRYDRVRAKVFEEKLDLIEQKLNNLDITVKIVDGNVKFKDRNNQKES